MFPLFETIRIENGVPMNLEWHQERVNASFLMLYGNIEPHQLTRIVKVSEHDREGTVKCRLLYNDRNYRLEFEPYYIRNIKSLKLVQAEDLDYFFKFTDRSEINKLFKLKGECDDILIVKDGLITDTSYTNILFYNGTKWITPAYPLLKGTCRNRLLKKCIIVEENITPNDLRSYISFMLVNAMMDYDTGRSVDIDGIKLDM